MDGLEFVDNSQIEDSFQRALEYCELQNLSFLPSHKTQCPSFTIELRCYISDKERFIRALTLFAAELGVPADDLVG